MLTKTSMTTDKLTPTKYSPNSFKTISLILISLVITSFLYHNQPLTLLFNITSYDDSLTTSNPSAQSSKSHDYNKYLWSKNILSNWDSTSENRLIAIGDIHGMLHPLKKLLKKLNYDPKVDTVVLVGDLAAKHPSIKSSLDTIRFCRQSNFQAVRGNHDQYIIIWRNWMEAHRDEFIQSDDILSNQADNEATLESDGWLTSPEPPQQLKHKLPEGMKWKTQHFEIARQLPKVDFLWMMERSLTIYVSPLRTYFVHAGMLPWDLPNEVKMQQRTSEAASLLDLKENKDPYTLLEMRGLKKGRRPSRNGDKGQPWFKYWNNVMTFSNQTYETHQWDSQPHHVVYGHWASRGLTIKPWSMGLDSGCVFGRQLSALVIGKEDIEVEKKKKFKIIPVPIYHKNAKIVQLSCHKP